MDKTKTLADITALADEILKRVTRNPYWRQMP